MGNEGRGSLFSLFSFLFFPFFLEFFLSPMFCRIWARDGVLRGKVGRKVMMFMFYATLFCSVYSNHDGGESRYSIFMYRIHSQSPWTA